MCLGRGPAGGSMLEVTDPGVPKDKIDGEIQYKEVVLAVAVYTKFEDLYKSFLRSTFYRILCETTQPAHFITALSVLCVAYLMFPNKNHGQTSPLWTLVYLGSFSAHFGAQIWMTFVSGLALYFTLPRHTFGNVQQVLFPKYFLINASLSFVTLAIFLKSSRHSLRTAEVAVQASGMTVCFFVELVIRLYLTPPLLSLMVEKNAIEKKAGIGMEVGKVNSGKLSNCPHYLKVHKKFRNVHMSIAILNILTMGCTMLHLYYLAHKLCAI